MTDLTTEEVDFVAAELAILKERMKVEKETAELAMLGHEMPNPDFMTVADLIEEAENE